jgi:hypothetical protein
MITRDEAYQKATRYILSEAPPGLDVVVPEEMAEDHGWCWVFYYDTRAYYEGDEKQTIFGAPVVVVKETGEMYVTGTAYPVEHFLEEIRQGRMPKVG